METHPGIKCIPCYDLETVLVTSVKTFVKRDSVHTKTLPRFLHILAGCEAVFGH